VLELIEPDYPSAATVSGDATLADTADLELSINEPVADPDQDASELSASGTINIAGATLSLSQTGAPNTNLCQALDPGDVYTLLSSTGTLTGTFAGVPDGSTVALPADCTDSTTPADVEINYTAHAVTATVLGLVPQNLSSPTIGGTLQSGQTLTAGAGSWSGNPSSYGYQWETCSGSSCTPITGATAPSYQLGSNDVGSGILLAVTATNASGTSTPAYSRISVPVESSPATASATPPLNSSVPTISGLSRVGDTLTATSGSWTGSGPMTYTYQWQRCESSCANIPGAVTAEYKLASADAGARVDVVVTATNGAGSATASSQQLGPVTQPGPTTAEIKSALSKVLVPTGRAAAIGYLLKAGGYSFTFPAPSGGALKLTWRSGSGARAVVVGTATLELHGSGKAKFKLELTAKGRHLLAHSNSLQIQATASFAPTGQSAVSDNADFRLKR
jgi:hypothetical protein